MIAAFDVCITHCQINVCVKNAPPVALAWTDDHGAQGFAWSPTQVGFGVPDHDGLSRLEVEAAPRVVCDPTALWAVQVPFDVADGGLLIGSIFDEREVDLSPGRYSLVFAALPGTTNGGTPCAYRLRLSFCADPAPDFAILVRGAELTTDKVLRRDTELI